MAPVRSPQRAPARPRPQPAPPRPTPQPAPQPAPAPAAAGTGRRVAAFVGRNRVVVLFLVGLIATDWLVGRYAAVWERHSPDDYAARVDGCRARRPDLVFVGGSPVAEGIDPERIGGLTWGGTPLAGGYAVGLSGGTTTDFYYGVKRACPTPPRVLVYGITASDLNDSRGEPHGPYSLMGWDDLAELNRVRPDAAGWATRHFLQGRLRSASHLWRHRHGIKMWASLEADTASPGSCPEATREAAELRDYADALRSGSGYAPQRGFVNQNYAAVKAAGLSPEPFTYLDRYKTGSHLRYLYRLIDWCEKAGTALVLVDMPVTADLEAAHAAAFATYRERLAGVAGDRRLPVIRATREAVGLTDAHFADLIHLNGDGARLFSPWHPSSSSFRGSHTVPT